MKNGLNHILRVLLNASFTRSRMDVLEGFAAVPREIAGLWFEHRAALAPWVALWFGLHVATQYLVPALFGRRVYAALNGDGKLPSAADQARDARTKVIAVVHALLVTGIALYGLWWRRADYLFLRSDVDAGTPLTQQLGYMAASYFLWDVVVVAIDGYSVEWHIHAWMGLAVFSASLRPFLHWMSLVTLTYEASTPFLHLRKLLIQRGAGHGALFTATQLLFAATFFLSRIVHGWYECGRWALQMSALLRAGALRSVPIVGMYMVLCVTSCVLNAMWAWQIAASAARRGPKARPARRAGSGEVPEKVKDA
jgi:hypothetical protein